MLAAHMPYKAHVHTITNDLLQPVRGWAGGIPFARDTWVYTGSTWRHRHEHFAEPRILKFTRWLNETRGLQLRPTTVEGYDAMWRWSVSDSKPSGARSGTTSPSESPTRHERVLAEAGDARRALVRGRAAELRAPGAAPCRPAHAAGHPAIVFQNERMAARWNAAARGRAAPPGGLAGGGAARHGRAARRPRAPSCPTRRMPSSPSSPRPAWARSGRCARPTWARWRCSTASARSSPVLIGVDGYVYGGVAHDRMAVLRQLLRRTAQRAARGAAALPRRERRCLLAAPGRGLHDFAALSATRPSSAPEWLPFDHPLWVVYSSGTTGCP